MYTQHRTGPPVFWRNSLQLHTCVSVSLQASLSNEVFRTGLPKGFISLTKEILLSFIESHFPVEVHTQVRKHSQLTDVTSFHTSQYHLLSTDVHTHIPSQRSGVCTYLCTACTYVCTYVCMYVRMYVYASLMAGTCSVYVADLAHAGTGVCAYSRYM